MMSDTNSGREDAALLTAIGRLWQQLDPPPADLAEGVLARLAAEDLEYDLLVLVESEDTLAGVRSAAGRTGADGPEEDSGSWSLNYAGSDFEVYLRMSRIEGHTRVDGWVVPARALTVRLRAGEATVLETPVDEHGRFEIAEAPVGLARLVFVDETSAAERPRITPPFWI